MHDRIKRIVVLDDDPEFASMVAVKLGEGYDLAVGHDGIEGLKLVQEHTTDLLITDIGLPGMNGIRLIAELHRRPETKNIPVIVLTGTNPQQISRSDLTENPQVKSILDKPIEFAELLKAVEEILVPKEGRDDV